MKLFELALAAFGPFTDRVLELSAGEHGLHVIFGRNEAGKSSALRGLHALLYGIPGQTDDAFLHPYDRLRIGGRLRLSTGEELGFVRRKGTKGTLLAPDETRLDDDALHPFLAGVTAEEFQRFWGIDHGRLVQGGRDILAGRGDLGETLFAAGSGLSHLRALRLRLDEEAAEYFLPRGQKPLVNLSLRELRELRAAQRDATLSVEDWARRERALHDAEEALSTSSLRREELARERSRLERLKRVLPLLAGRDEARRRLAAVGDVVLLAPDFAERRLAAEHQLRSALHREERATGELERQEGLVAELGPTPALAAEADAVSDLFTRLGSHRKAMADRPKLAARRDELRAQAKRRLAGLRPDLDLDGVEALRVFVGRRARIQQLATQHGELEGRRAAARARLAEALAHRHELEAAAPSLPPACDPGPLAVAIEEARRRGDAEAALAKSAQAVARLDAKVAALLGKLGLPGSATAAPDALPVPPTTTIAAFERRAMDLEQATRAAAEERQRVARTAREVEAKVQKLTARDGVPTEAAVWNARARRDAAFALLRDRWEQGRDVAAAARELLGEGELADLYSASVAEADALADRLRREADRVAELAQLLGQREELADDDRAAAVEAERLAALSTALEEEWREAWKGVPSVAPRFDGARAWREDLERLVALAEELAGARAEHAELATWVDRQIAHLGAAVAALDPDATPAGTLAANLAAADRVRQRAERDRLAREQHERDLKANDQAVRAAEGAIRDVEGQLEGWRVRWGEAVGGLSAGDVPAPDDAPEVVEEVDATLRGLDEAAALHSRVEAIDRDAGSFRADARALADRLGEGPTLGEDAEGSWVDATQRRLLAALKQEERRRQATTLRDTLESDLAAAGEAVASARAALAALRAEAKCDADDDLSLAERRSADLRTARAEVEGIERELVRSGDGHSVEALDAEGTGTDSDAVEGRLAAVADELGDVEKRVAEAYEARAEARAALQGLQGPSEASDCAERTQSTLARLRDEVLSYARLRLASAILARRIEAFRRDNQAPLLLRAGAHFRAMTLGAFDRLEADVEDDRPVLVGIRPDGRRVPAAGMSEGTADQVFLALRLAAVEASCAAGEPMPFVVDDILVQFDDERTAAALQVLADVARQTQVVLFTHHRQVRASAEALTAPAGVFVHEL